MSKGDGSIIERSKGVWEVQLSLGRDPITKRYRKISRTVKGTKTDARKVRDQLRREHESGLRLDADKMTFGQFAEQWLNARIVSGSFAERTLDGNRNALKSILGYISDLKLKEITPDVVESLYAALMADKTRNGKPPSSTTMHNYHVLLKQMMKQACMHDLILRNPCDRVKAPKIAPVERRSLSIEGANKLLDCLDRQEADALADLLEKESRQHARGNASNRSSVKLMHMVGNVLAVRIGLATGMRLGEVLGLPWCNVDFQQGTIRVSQSLTNHNTIKATKSGKPRTIAIDPKTLKHLARWKEAQKIQLLKLSIAQNGDTPVCCSDIGGWNQPNNFERWWRTFRAANGFDGLKFHELRHTQATQLLANGVDVKTVQERLGHASADITLDCYAHALPENDKAAADLIGDLFTRKPSENGGFKLIKSA